MAIKDTLSLTIPASPIQYDVVFGEYLLKEVFVFLKSYPFRDLLITTTTIAKFLPDIQHHKIILQEELPIKSRGMKENIEDLLIKKGYGRDTCLIAVGGGELLDLIGFVASTYCRGIPYISIPTTLIAMTDASIGGKTGVNLKDAKNWIGTFYHPMRVFIDFSLLTTLPQQEFVYGLAETIKHSLIADRDFFDFLELNYVDILARDPLLIQEMIRRSCLIKQSIVEKDPYEIKGLRQILNFGHSIGHALETFSNYTLAHGQAVFIGMLVEAAIARRLGYLSSASYERIRRFFDKLPIRVDLPYDFPYQGLAVDKKGAYQFVVLRDLGLVVSSNGKYTADLTKEYLDLGWQDVMCSY
ncbi:MAG: 3-dehydroquinate synthase [Chlamydiales bacterium]